MKKRYIIRARRIFPNFVTVLALCSGFSCIFFSLNEAWSEAVLCILVASFLDGIDGRIARLIDGTTEFGADLDSLVDLANFGSASGVMFYLFSLRELNQAGWAIILLFLGAMAIRLARFNSSIQSLGPFLVGVPAPFGAIIASMPMMFYLAFDIKLSSYIHGIFCVVSAILMISKLPTISIKKLKIPRRFFWMISFCLTCIVSFFLYNKWLAILLLSGVYLLSIPLIYFRYKRMIKNDGILQDV
ncbi:CDP-alcohol phosphatidyltransferase family protein [Candidatus Gromoviella agglomerans]|uniref:CDP-alcohol phosphatidyltransferase family protein n=1 Tax=Candidatus Gromoviella agglomerans TaxID=2806609 RepID=UPI001E6330E2|nr:CDP-alcohol phosphatidyltransferase family protein [Candidatus Gromoviella agglomerans]